MSLNKRMDETLKHRSADRTPFFEYVLHSPIADYILGRPFHDYEGNMEQWCLYAGEVGWEKAVRQYAVDRVDIAEKLGHDLIYGVPSPLPAEVERLSSKSESDTSTGHFHRYLADDPVATIQKRIEHDMVTLESPTNTDAFVVYELIKEELERRGYGALLLAPAYFHGVWTDVDLMMTMVLSPETAHKHYEIATKKALRYVNEYLRIGVELIGVGGDFAGNRPIISPESYRSFIMPEIKKVSDIIHEAGNYSVNTSDGNLWPVIDDFLIGCGTDGYLEIDANAGMTLKELKLAYGDRITFFGNMDCGLVLSFSSPEEIREKTIQCLKDGYGNGGHVFCVSNAITASVPLKNYMAMVNAYKDYYDLPRINIE